MPLYTQHYARRPNIFGAGSGVYCLVSAMWTTEGGVVA